MPISSGKPFDCNYLGVMRTWSQHRYASFKKWVLCAGLVLKVDSFLVPSLCHQTYYGLFPLEAMGFNNSSTLTKW